MLLDALWKSPDPDEALNQFERFVAAAGPRTAWLDLLAGRRLLANLVQLCARGELVTQLLLTQPELLGSLADPATFAAPKSARDFRLAGAGAGARDATERKDRLRRLKQAEELRSDLADAPRRHRRRSLLDASMTALAQAALAVALADGGGRRGAATTACRAMRPAASSTR